VAEAEDLCGRGRAGQENKLLRGSAVQRERGYWCRCEIVSDGTVAVEMGGFRRGRWLSLEKKSLGGFAGGERSSSGVGFDLEEEGGDGFRVLCWAGFPVGRSTASVGVGRQATVEEEEDLTKPNDGVPSVCVCPSRLVLFLRAGALVPQRCSARAGRGSIGVGGYD
jgi:hypothetical protein